jgi:DNA-binding NtrC family response regulator
VLPPLVDLCPPPRALAGEACTGTVSRADIAGRLAHRHAEFIALRARKDDPRKNRDGPDVLILLAEKDLSPAELASEATVDPSADELHRTIRRFRRGQANYYAVESLLGESLPMQKLRAQVDAAAASGANVLVIGKPGTGRGHVARAIHYCDAAETAARLVPVDCDFANDDMLRRAVDALRSSGDERGVRPTLLLQNLDRLDHAYQSQILSAIQQGTIRARLIATCSPAGLTTAGDDGAADSADSDSDRLEFKTRPTVGIDSGLHSLVSTIAIEVPTIAERMTDLPILAQYFLESCNQGGGKQVGSIRRDALDKLALYTWPGGLVELRHAIESSHAACASHEIVPSDLPAVVHHASATAARSRRPTERIVLDDLLARIEREAIVRALAQADGNKTEAAALLGMTRPRLYRRLVQLGLVVESAEADVELPEFVETPPGDEAT